MDETSPQPQVESSVPAKPTIKFSLILLVVGELAIVGYFSSAYYFTLWPFEVSVAPVPTFTPRPSSTVKSEDISTWETYRNDQFGFEIKYPENMHFCLNDFCVPIPPEPGYSNCNPDFCITEKTSIQYVKIWGEGQDDIAHKLEIRPLINRLGISAIEFAKIVQSTNEKDNAYVPNSGKNIVFSDHQAYQFEVVNGFTETGIIIKNSIEAYRGDGSSGWVVDSPTRVIYFDNNGILFRVAYPINDLLFDQILSTFRFIEPINTSTWKTYRNTQLGFEFKYPENWILESHSSDIAMKYPDVDYNLEEPLPMSVIWENTTFTNINAWYNSNYTEPSFRKDNPDLIPEKEDFKIDNVNAVRYVDPIQSGSVTGQVALIKNGKLFKITFSIDSYQIDQILSAFKFNQ